MKVLYIVHSTMCGGATISFLNMILGLKNQGVSPIVVSPDIGENEQFDKTLKDNNIPHYKICIVSSYLPIVKFDNIFHWINRFVTIPIKKRRSMRQLREVIRKEAPVIIHTNTGVVHEGYKVARNLGLPHVWHLREYQTLDFHWYILPSASRFRKMLKQSYVVTISDGIRSYFGLTDSPNAHTIYNGIYKQNDIRFNYPKSNYFLCASRISPVKGHDDVIEAFALFVKDYPNYRLKILGDGKEDYVRHLKKKTILLGCADKVDFIGMKYDVREWMSNAKSLIVASKFEGFGRMTAESAFCGTLVIGRNTGGTSEIINKIGGLLFDDISGLRKQMVTLTSLSEEEYSKMVLSAQKTAADLYSIENNVIQIKMLYESICHRKSIS